MTKKLAALVCGATFAFSAVCSATVAPEKISVGGITPGMTPEQVIAAIGEPLAKNQMQDEWFYKEFELDFAAPKGSNEHVEQIKSRTAGVKTGAGFTVGDKEDVVEKALGKPDKKYFKKNVETLLLYYSNDKKQVLSVRINDGVITKITSEFK